MIILLHKQVQSDLIETLATAMLAFIISECLSKMRTIGHVFMAAIHVRLLKKCKTLPRMQHMCFMDSLSCQILRDIMSNISKAAALTPAVTWMLVQTYYDCVVLSCSNLIKSINLRLYPTGIRDGINLSDGLLVRIIPISRCTSDEHDV